MAERIYRTGPGEWRELDYELDAHYQTLVAHLRSGGAEPAAPPEVSAAPQRQQQLFLGLVRDLKQDGFDILPHPLPFAGDGMVLGSHIYVADNDYKFLTLVHEYAHVLLHPEGEPQLPEYLHRLYFPDVEYRMPVPTRVAECGAEGVAYLVLSHYGFPAQRCISYLREQGVTAEEVEAQVDALTRAAAAIIQRLAES